MNKNFLAKENRLNAMRKRRRVQRYVKVAREIYGYCPCFKCGEPVFTADELALRALDPKAIRAALPSYEHIKPTSLGGNDSFQNFAVSHQLCNHKRGNKYEPEQ